MTSRALTEEEKMELAQTGGRMGIKIDGVEYDPGKLSRIQPNGPSSYGGNSRHESAESRHFRSNIPDVFGTGLTRKSPVKFRGELKSRPRAQSKTQRPKLKRITNF